MSTAGKIRLLLALLSVTLLFTATIVKTLYTPLNNLDQTAQTLEYNIHNKEAVITKLIDNSSAYQNLKTLQNNPKAALDLINEFTTGKSTWILTFTNDSLSFWSGIKVIPKNNEVKEGVSFIQQPNGYYEAIKKSEGHFSAIFLFPVKIKYQFQNQYLQNKFAADLLNDDNVDIAGFNDPNVFSIHSSINNAYLFSVKLKKDKVGNDFFHFELVIWFLTFITLCLLIQTICKYFEEKGSIILSIVILLLFVAVLRFVNLYFHWPGFIYQLEIFNPSIFRSGSLYPSLGDFALNTFFITWFVAFLYAQRKKLPKILPGKILNYVILIICIVTLLAITISLQQLFFNLINKSSVNFNVYDVLNLSKLSFFILVLICFSFLIFFLLCNTFTAICIKLIIPDFWKISLFSLFLIGIVVFTAWNQPVNLCYLLLAVPVALISYAYRFREGRVDSTPFIIIVFVCSLIAFIKYYDIETTRDTETRVAFINKLNDPDDATADRIFRRIEYKILSDQLITKYAGDSLHYTSLLNRFQKSYFDDYLSRYGYKIYEFDENGLSLTPDKNTALNHYRNLVTDSSYKISDYFYRVNQVFGSQNYFAILPIKRPEATMVTMVVDLVSKPSQPQGSFPDLLKDDSVKLDKRFKNYSFAFYKDNKLKAKGGSYGYDIINTTFKGKLNNFNTSITKVNYNSGWYKSLSTYKHLVYKPCDGELIVVSKEENSLFQSITSLTFFFILLLLFSITIIAVRWLWLRINILTISNNRLKWNFKINFDKILYKTRIQFSIISAVVVTLLFVGFTTFISLGTQYNEQQENMIREKITHITASYQNGLLDKYISNINDENQLDFDNLANTYSTDLILYNLKGVPLITTQPRIYDDNLLPRRINAKAFINLSKLHKSEFINNEIIGGLQYRSVYAPLLNAKGVTRAYLELPYFSDDADYNSRIVSLLNIMINVYALIFIVIGLFAVIIARQITAPLSFMQVNLSKIIYGRKNEPIKWERDDEIGALVNEYNKMISALENSAQKLAQSERESAWREMAKQVAHEIKNPLTPLKLGLQLLEKSWRDKDPKFDAKFERFSKSFVEQIESLSSIASEFSSFAKMPDTRLERINIFDMLAQAVTIFVHMDNIKINYIAPETSFYIKADRDQLLRCFNNLLKNAIEASQHQHPGIIDIKYTITEKNILLSIKDNGDGIPEGMQTKIFEPNFTTKSSGTGLGLAFVKNSIENASGSVWFETVQGVGTTFYLNLPAAL